MKFSQFPSPGGSLRNTLGSELKRSGVFQKDGRINNSRGGFIGQKKGRGISVNQGTGFAGQNPPVLSPNETNQKKSLGGGGTMGKGPFSNLGSGMGGMKMYQPKQLILEPAQQGIAGNGIATISPDNSFNLVANLPPPHTLMGYGSHTYAAYLVDSKSKNGFLAGVLRPVGNGVYQAQFQSQVPLVHYNRVIISMENPMQLGHSPAGPIILKVKESMGAVAFLAPIKSVGGGIWRRVSGLFKRKTVEPEVPIGEGIPEVTPIPQGVIPPPVSQEVQPPVPPLKR